MFLSIVMSILLTPIIVLTIILFSAPWFKPSRFVSCNILKWHSFIVGYYHTDHDGCSQHAKCKWCGYEGMIDSQGNLF